jgi:hypothetical protein
MTPSKDPAVLGPDERLAEISDLLATAYRRLVLARRKGLALEAESEPSCGAAVNAAETKTPLKGAA